MNRIWTRLGSTYRKEPISSFILTVGAVDAAIGGIGNRSSLLALGLGAVAVALVLRGWLLQRHPARFADRPPVRYLPSRTSRPQIPSLDLSQRQPPN